METIQYILRIENKVIVYNLPIVLSINTQFYHEYGLFEATEYSEDGLTIICNRLKTRSQLKLKDSLNPVFVENGWHTLDMKTAPQYKFERNFNPYKASNSWPGNGFEYRMTSPSTAILSDLILTINEYRIPFLLIENTYFADVIGVHCTRMYQIKNKNALGGFEEWQDDQGIETLDITCLDKLHITCNKSKSRYELKRLNPTCPVFNLHYAYDAEDLPRQDWW